MTPPWHRNEAHADAGLAGSAPLHSAVKSGGFVPSVCRLAGSVGCWGGGGGRRCFVPRVPLTTRHKNSIGFTILLRGMWGWPLLHGISQSVRFVERIREEARTEYLLCFIG